MDNLTYYRLQMALKSGSGFELITTVSEQSLIDEIRTAQTEHRFARIASDADNSLSALAFDPKDISAYQHGPVNRVQRV